MKDKKTPITISKGDFLIVKSPPYYREEYFYEVTGAGDKVIRANLHHSPKVRKSWNIDELKLLIEMKIVRIASKEESPASPPV
jgi:hypothetical protein